MGYTYFRYLAPVTIELEREVCLANLRPSWVR